MLVGGMRDLMEGTRVRWYSENTGGGRREREEEQLAHKIGERLKATGGL